MTHASATRRPSTSWCTRNPASVTVSSAPPIAHVPTGWNAVPAVECIQSPHLSACRRRLPIDQFAQRRGRGDPAREPNSLDEHVQITRVGEIRRIDRGWSRGVGGSEPDAPRLLTSTAIAAIEIPRRSAHPDRAIWRSGARRSGRARTNPPASAPLEVSGPRPSRSHRRAFSAVASSDGCGRRVRHSAGSTVVLESFADARRIRLHRDPMST